MSTVLTPALPVLTIEKNDSSLYNFNPFGSPVTFDFKVKKCKLTPPVDSSGGKFSITIYAPDKSNATMNSILENIENGNEITGWVGKDEAGLAKFFLGVIQNITVNEITPNYMEVTLDGPDWGSDMLKNRISLYYKVQRYKADQVTLDPTDPNVTIPQIASDLLTAKLAYPFVDITAEDQGLVFDTDNIDISLQEVRVAQILANYEHLDDKLSELDNWCNAVHYVDPDKNFIMRPAVPQPNPSPGTTPGTWLFTDSKNDSLISDWQTGNVGFISMIGASYKYSTENYKARIIGLGGDQISIDGSVLGTPVEQTDDSGGYTALDTTHWLAQKFTPVYAQGYSIALLVAYQGLTPPSANMEVLIIQDNGGAPTGPVLATLSIPNSSFSSSPQWIQINVGQDYLTPNPYWIVIPPNPNYGALGGPTYLWYKGGSGFTTSTSTDGVTWTPSTGEGYCFIEYTSTPLALAMPGIGLSPTQKCLHEEVYRQAFITTSQALVPYLTMISLMTNFKKEIGKYKISVPDNVPSPFASVLLRKIASGLVFNTSDNPPDWVLHIIGQIDLNFQATDEETTGMLWMDIQLVRFTTFP